MREIKFRAWNGKEIFNIDVLAITPCIWDCQDEKRGVSLAYQPHIKVMQYTGLKDKNGVEIYDGDILKANQITTKVHWGETGWYETVIKSPFNHLRETFKITDYAKCEVVGNIHENPELLIQQHIES